jgi:hypothetical protein
MGGAEGAGRVDSAVSGLLKHFFQISMPIRKIPFHFSQILDMKNTME